MRTGSYVFIIGIFLIILPFLGIPSVWKQYLTIGLGVALLFFGYIIRRRQFLMSHATDDGEFVTETFVETTPEMFR
jgi:FtsH-binding integral membrane protein